MYISTVCVAASTDRVSCVACRYMEKIVLIQIRGRSANQYIHAHDGSLAVLCFLCRCIFVCIAIPSVSVNTSVECDR